MPLDRDLIKKIRALDQYDLRRLGILVKGLLVQQGDPPDAAESKAPIAKAGKVGYRLEKITCGRPGCTKCPHGPYWYAYWREGARVRSKYIGRELPAGAKRSRPG